MNSLNHSVAREAPSYFRFSLLLRREVEEKDDSLTNFESQPRDVHRAGGRANICADIILREEKAKAEVKRGTGAWAGR